MDIINENAQHDGVNIGGSQINILMYADDLILVSNTTLGLQDYCNKWKLNVNLSKSNVMICNQSGRRSGDEIWFYGDQILNVCDTYNYLGISFTSGGIINTSFNVLRNQAKK